MLRGAQLSIKSGFFTFEAAPKAVIDAVTELQVTQQSGQRGGFQLHLTYGKGGQIERELLPGGFFSPATRFIFSLTIDGVSDVLMDGFVSRVDVSQSNQPGKSTLSITGSDASQMMDQLDLTGLPMPAMPYMAQVAFILARYTPLGVIPVILPPITWSVDNPLRKYRAQQGTDYAHVMMLARDVGYAFYVEPTPQEGVCTAYWGPDVAGFSPGGAIDGLEIQPALTVNMDQASNVESLNFNFDGLSKTLYYTIYRNSQSGVAVPIPIPDIALNPPLGPEFLMYAKNKALSYTRSNDTPAGMAREDVAVLISRGLGLAANSANVVGASGALDVARYGRLLKPRRLVAVRGAGPHHDGHYYVRNVTTKLKRGEIKQTFSLTRNALGSWSERVA
ncbi:hypothetical protein [Caulobacter endophyticus]|uniref:hypothetical protein n=1 Tax=Caulobacter endophyticus TaxID=2172652 RepID=UPI00240EC863|nr:hypothetical protein [Caulobacter endophyticus]MDG2527887.1 hypothetical protein [Caulobacter endophyticus]